MVKNKQSSKSKSSGKSNAPMLICFILSSIFFSFVGYLTWYDMSVGKNFGEIFFGSRTMEAMSLGIDMKTIHYLIIGLLVFITGLFLFLRKRILIKNRHLVRTIKYQKEESWVQKSKVEPESKSQMEQKKKGHKLNVWRRLISVMRPYRLSFALVFIASLSSVPLSLLSPLPLKIIVDNILGSQPLPGFIPEWLQSSHDYLILIAIGLMLGIEVLALLQSVISTWLSTKLTLKVTLNLRTRLFNYMQRLSLSYHDVKGTTDSIYRLQYDTLSFSDFALSGLLPLIGSTLTLIGMIIVTAYFDWQLALVAMVVSPMLLFFTLIYRKKVKNKWSKVKKLESKAMSVAQESLGALRVVKAFGQEDQEKDRFFKQSNKTASATLGVYLDERLFSLLTSLTTAIGLAIVLVIGIYHVQSGILSLGGLLMVNTYMLQLYSPMKSLGKTLIGMQKSLVSAERVFALLDAEPDVKERPDAIPIAKANGQIAFQDVSFEYEVGHPVLKNISFSLQPGSRLGIVGATGSGKTTLNSLMLRFFDPTEGKILLDHIDLKDFKLSNLRNQFAVVLQETVLFSTSVAENVRFAKPEASFDEIVAAAKAANADDFIKCLPNGYDTLVGERGMLLSGGERQRISLARAFLKDAPILILDEPTSSLDINTEAVVLDAINRLMEGRTTIMIAHRLTTLKNCDMLLILENGNVKEITTDVQNVIRKMLDFGMEIRS